MIFSENYRYMPRRGQNFQPAQKYGFLEKKLSRDLKLPRPPKLNRLVPLLYVPTNRLTVGCGIILVFEIFFRKKIPKTHQKWAIFSIYLQYAYTGKIKI